MDDAGKAAAESLLDGANLPHRDLPDRLGALMRALAERTCCRGASLHLDGVGRLTVGRLGGAIDSSWIAEGYGLSTPQGRSRGGNPAPARPWLSGTGGSPPAVEPITYAGEPAGELSLWPQPTGEDGVPPGLLGRIGKQAVYAARRYQVAKWSGEGRVRPLLAGFSQPMRELDAFLETAARRSLPVLIRGEFGTEKAPLAASIHGGGPAADGPFVQVDCGDPDGVPADWVGRAQGGTLFLHGVDELSPALQRGLLQHLSSRLGQWLSRQRPAPVRLIASTTEDLHRLTAEGRLSPALLAELDFLSVTIPPLRERPDDLDILVVQALHRNGFDAGAKCGPALLDGCRRYGWPGNLFELEQTVARLAVASDGRVGEEEIGRHAPFLLVAGRASKAACAPSSAERWARHATGTDEAPPGALHGALRRALDHLGCNYDRPIAMAELARAAGVSPSHLGFLFRTGLGLSFKTLLGHIRIGRAREILAGAAAPTITQVALDVGYGDLSHFERRFRSIVGESPREYRRRSRVPGPPEPVTAPAAVQ